MKSAYLKRNPCVVDELLQSQTAEIDDFPQYRLDNQVEDQILHRCQKEYMLYRNLEDIDLSHDTLTWYKLYAPSFPTIGTLARSILCIPPSQCAVERVFSVAGHVASSRRSRLSIENLEILLTFRLYQKAKRSGSVDSFLEAEIERLDEYHDEYGFDEEPDVQNSS